MPVRSQYRAKTDVFGIGYSALQHPSALLFAPAAAGNSGRLHMGDVKQGRAFFAGILAMYSVKQLMPSTLCLDR